MRNPAIPYVAPFILFLVFLSLDGKLGLIPDVEYPLRVVVMGAAIWFWSRGVVSFEIRIPLATLGIGVLVFVLWVGPDLLFPEYRHHWLFQNSILGSPPSPTGGYVALSPVSLLFRTVRAVVIVPIVEELFWRGWLMRWLIKPEFKTVPLGTYGAQAFWVTAVLFALEHGSYWDVGLVAGAIYNFWMIRTKSLGDCILAHAVTNAILSGYVMVSGQWQYW